MTLAVKEVSKASRAVLIEKACKPLPAIYEPPP